MMMMMMKDTTSVLRSTILTGARKGNTMVMPKFYDAEKPQPSKRAGADIDRVALCTTKVKTKCTQFNAGLELCARPHNLSATVVCVTRLILIHNMNRIDALSQKSCR